MIMSVEQGRNQTHQPLSRGMGSKGPQRRKPQHEIMEELSDNMSKQQQMMTKEMTKMSNNIKHMTKNSKSDSITAERIHDRLESLVFEQRATNILLAKLVAMNESVLLDRDRVLIPNRAENLRHETYNRVSQGE